MSRRIRIINISICLSIIFSLSKIYAQNGSSSPYSRYGIGDFQFAGLAKNLGMGAIANGMNLPFNLNLSNPAGYSGLQLTTYEAGVNMNQVELSTNTKKQRSFTASLAYFAFGFPVKSKVWGLGFGLLPYSNVGYEINKSEINSLSVKESHTYKGSGGLNQFYLSNGFKLKKNLSAGITASYLFGVINHDRTVEFESAYLFNSKISNSTSLGWFNFNFGIQYTFDSLRIVPSDSLEQLSKELHLLSDSLRVIDGKINNGMQSTDSVHLLISRSALRSSITQTKEIMRNVKHRHDKSDWSATIGIIGSPSSDLRGRNSYLAESFKYYNYLDPTQVVVKDTVEYENDVKGKVKLPWSIGIGLVLKNNSRWQLGADFSVQHWKDFSYFGQSDSLADSWRVAAGAQFTPSERSRKSYLKLVQYRIGGHFSQTFLQLNGKQLNELGVSLGFGLPIPRVATTIQIAAEAGKRGTRENNLINENYFRVTVGFTLCDRWFIKPKYD